MILANIRLYGWAMSTSSNEMRFDLASYKFIRKNVRSHACIVLRKIESLMAESLRANLCDVG